MGCLRYIEILVEIKHLIHEENSMKKKQVGFLAFSFFTIYFIIVCFVMFSKPQGWSMWPYSWQQSWHPNYLLFTILVVVGALISYGVYYFFSEKETK